MDLKQFLQISWMWSTVCQSLVGRISGDFFSVSSFRRKADTLKHLQLYSSFELQSFYLFVYFYFHKSKYSLIARKLCYFTCLKILPVWPERCHSLMPYSWAHCFSSSMMRSSAHSSMKPVDLEHSWELDHTYR